MPPALGLEIGGTKLQAGIGTAGGPILGFARQRVEPVRGAEGIREVIPALIHAALAAAGISGRDLTGIGVGFGGPVDPARGVTLLSHQIDGWREFPLRAWIEEQWRIPAAIRNDAGLAAYAEARAGAGRGCRRIFYVTVGSGVGGGLVTDGVVDEGQGLGAGEIGHTWVPDPATGRAVALESVCSGWSIARRARERRPASGTGRPDAASGGELTAETVHADAVRGDAACRRVIEDAARTLAVGLANMVALFHPQRIILGGGVPRMGPLFWDPLRDEIRRRAFAPFAAGFEIVPAALGAEVVVVGGILLGAQASQGSKGGDTGIENET